MRLHVLGVLGASLICACSAVESSDSAISTAGESEIAISDSSDFVKTDARAIGLATVAKELCSAVFVSEIEADFHLANNAKFWMPNEDRSKISSVDVNKEQRRVTLTVDELVGAAEFIGAKGCVALGPDRSSVDLPFEPLSPAVLNMEETWPRGDIIPGNLASGIDPVALDRAVSLAFADDAFTGAFIVIHNGNIIAERYDLGVTPTTRLPGWSIAKSLQSTLVGRLEQEGRLALYEPVAIDAWSGDGDPRANTTLADLIRMSAPVSCGNTQSWHDQAAWPVTGYPESFYVFSGPSDSYSYSINRPPLGTDEPRGVYTNCQPMIIGHVLQKTLEQDGKDITSYAQSALYEPLSMNPVIMEPDRSGNLLTAGYALATPRDWARLGLLYANEGVWEGERLLSPDFMSFVRAPGPHWERPIYGGQVWLNAEACLFDQCDAYQFNGIEGQRVVIFPSLDLVVARFGFGAGDVPNPDPTARRPAIAAMNASIQAIIDLVGESPSADETAVWSAVQQFFEAMSNHDRFGYDSVLTEGFRLLEAGEVWSADYTWQRAARPDREERWTLSQPRITVDQDMAFVDYRNTGAFTDDDGRAVFEWLESAVLVRKEGAWRLALLHSTPIDQVQ